MFITLYICCTGSLQFSALPYNNNNNNDKLIKVVIGSMSACKQLLVSVLKSTMSLVHLQEISKPEKYWQLHNRYNNLVDQSKIEREGKCPTPNT